MSDIHATHRHTSHEHEHDFEVEPGLPQPLPRGEQVLWRGSPDWRVLARECFHVRKLAVYFAVLVVWRAGTVIHDSANLSAAIVPTLIAVGLAVLALGIVSLLAWFSARTTIYTLTDRRIVMRVGIVLSVTFNLPFKHVEAANLRGMKDGYGDIALSLDDSTRIAYLHLWPHARPWRVARVEPSLRSIADAADVAQKLTAAWKSLRTNEPTEVVAVHEATLTRPVIRPSAPMRPVMVPSPRTGNGPRIAAAEAA
ncbi:MAG: photosynthetic complex putative assembly protein PuhB [Burkholderiaceae bacterium]